MHSIIKRLVDNQIIVRHNCYFVKYVNKPNSKEDSNGAKTLKLQFEHYESKENRFLTLWQQFKLRLIKIIAGKSTIVTNGVLDMPRDYYMLINTSRSLISNVRIKQLGPPPTLE